MMWYHKVIKIIGYVMLFIGGAMAWEFPWICSLLVWAMGLFLIMDVDMSKRSLSRYKS